MTHAHQRSFRRMGRQSKLMLAAGMIPKERKAHNPTVLVDAENCRVDGECGDNGMPNGCLARGFGDRVLEAKQKEENTNPIPICKVVMDGSKTVSHQRK